MGLRIASAEDKELIRGFATKFLEVSGYDKHADMDIVDNLIDELITDVPINKLMLLHGNEGMLAGMVVPFIFGNKLIATEIAWWVEPEHRKSGVGGELIDAFEYWATQVGCDLISLSSLDDNLGKYYEKRGFKIYERAYIKEIK